jgi:hypothetical protein
MCLCKYKDIFGKPREGIHSYRFMDFAIIDIIVTIIGVYYLSQYTKYNFYKVLLFVFILGIIIHKLFCVNTKLNSLIFN